MDEITIDPTVNESSATVEFLDGDDMALTDADTVEDDFQVALAEGANTIKVKVTAKDGVTTRTYTVVVTRAANAPPVVANAIPDQVAIVDAAFSYAFPADTFEDADGDPLTYTATLADGNALPAWLVFTAGTRTFAGTPAATDAGTVAVKVTASDGEGSASDEFDIKVATTDVCNRTPKVRDAIVGKVSGVSDCADLTPAHLAGISGTMGMINRGISSLQAGDFVGLTGLTNLSLSTNRLASLPDDIFDDLTALESLALSSNNLASLPEGVFDALATLNQLYLNNNSLASLPEGVFDALTALTRLHLDENSLASLPEGIFDSLTELEVLYLYLNPGAPFSPTVNAGADQSVLTGASVTLAGTVTGPWGDNVTLKWTQVDGASSDTEVTSGAVTLDDDEIAAPSFTAPATAATLHFRLVATPHPGANSLDGLAKSTDWVTVEVTLPASTDASLSGLELTWDDSGTATDIVLSPTFATTTTTYAASVANVVARITVAPTVNDTNATVAYLDAGDSALTDADTVAEGFQVDLAVGANTIKVKVTAEDGMTTDTYTVTVTRAEVTSDDATLSALALSDGGGAAVQLSPSFTPGTTSYRALVANAVDAITIAPQLADGNAGYDILDDSNMELTDADSVAIGFQVALDVGTNTIEVRVTAEDGSTETYTVTVDRLAAPSVSALVSNLVMTNLSAITIESDHPWAQQFTTGGERYLLSSVVLAISSADSQVTPRVRIFTTNEFNNPGSKRYTLNNPDSLTGNADNTFTAPAGAVLEPNTDYFVRLEATGDYTYGIRTTNVSAEFGEPGWSIADTSKERPFSLWHGRPYAFKIAVHGGPNNNPARGTPVISGVPQVGRVLTADVSGILDADGVPNTLTYQWVRGSTNIPGETGSTYTPVAADIGERLKVGVSFTDNEGNAEGPLESAATAAVVEALRACPAGNDWCAIMAVGSATSTIPGTLFYGYDGGSGGGTAYGALDNDTITFGGDTWTVDTIVFEDATGSDSFRILLDSSVPHGSVFTVGGTEYIANADTESSSGAFVWQPVTDPVWIEGQQVRVSVEINRPVAGEVEITGTPQVGQTLTADISGLTDDDGLPSTFTYEWRRGPNEISGATGSTYVPIEADVGSVLRVDVSYTDNGGFEERVESAGTDPVVAGAGDCPAGNDWCALLTVEHSGNFYGYDSVDLDLSDLTDTTIDYGGVTSTIGRLGYVDDSPQQLQMELAPLVPQGSVFNIGGTDFTADADSAGDEMYRWEVSGFAWIEGQQVRVSANLAPVVTDAVVTDNELVLTFAEDLDTSSKPEASAFSVSVEGSAAAPASVDSISGRTVTLTLAAEVPGGQEVTVSYTVPISNPLQDASGLDALGFTGREVTNNAGNTPAEGAPGIDGTPQVGQTLTATSSTISDSDGLPSTFPGDYAFQWLRRSVAISGATSSTYVPVAADEGETLGVRVSFTDGGGTLEMLESDATDAVVEALRACPAGADWCATMTVGKDTGSNGGDNYGYDDGALGTSTGSLDDTTIDIGSNPYTVKAVVFSDDDTERFIVHLDRHVTRGSVFTLAGTELTANATSEQATNGLYRWDATIAPGWIEGQRVRVSLKFRVFSSDATLSALALTDGGGAAVQLRPSFAPGTTSYRALVSNVVDAITIAPQLADGNAGYDILDDSNMLLTDADLVANGFQVALDEGANPIKVRVTAEDGNSTRTYTVTVDRFAAPSFSALVSNLINTDFGTIGIGSEDPWAQQFTTGDERYLLSSVVLSVSSANSQVTPLVRIYTSNDSDNPGSRLYTLNNPASLTGDATFTAPLGAVLEPNTDYFVRLEADANYLTLRTTDIGTESGEPGWSIADTSKERPFSLWHGRPYAFKIAVQGAPIENHPARGTPVISGVPQVGRVLTADVSGILDVQGVPNTLTYQWVRGSTNIPGETGSTYTPVAADIGETLKVNVSFTDNEGNAEGPLESAATAAVVEALRACPAGNDWCAIMTVGSATSTIPGTLFYGYDGGSGGGTAYGALDNDTITFGGDTWTVDTIVFEDATGSDSFRILLDSSVPHGSVFTVGGTEYIANADTESSSGAFVWQPVTDPVWIEGQQVRVTNTGLTALQAGIFDKLGALKDLLLYNNSLSNLPAGLFDDLTALEELWLDRNDLSTLPDDIFEPLTALTDLLLNGNPGAPFRPTANAGADRSVATGASVTLSGTATGPWGDNVTWQWTQVDGAASDTEVTSGAVTLDDDEIAAPTFTAPAAATTLYFKLVATPHPNVNSGYGLVASAADWVTVEVTSATSTDASLSDLELTWDDGGTETDITLSPAFASGTTNQVICAANNGAADPDRGFRVRFGTLAKGLEPYECPPEGEKGACYDEANFTIRDNDSVPEVRASDASAQESSPEPWLEFRVVLSVPPPDDEVRVDYETVDGTAKAGEDYEAVSGTLTFPRGETERSVYVWVLEDDHDEDAETMTLVLSNPVNATLVDGTAIGTISNDDAMPRAWLARFGRTVADQVLDAVEDRMRGSRAPGRVLTLAGRTVDGDVDLEALEKREAAEHRESFAAWMRGEAPEGEEDEAGLASRELTAREILTGSSFALTTGTAEGGSAAVWGRGAVSRFDGREGKLTLDGKVTSAMLGADFTSGRGAAGVALAHSRGEGDYRSPSGGGEVASTLTGLYPWGRYEASERVSVWGVAGYGEGTLELTPRREVDHRDRPRARDGGGGGARGGGRGAGRGRARARGGDRCAPRAHVLGRGARERGEPRRVRGRGDAPSARAGGDVARHRERGRRPARADVRARGAPRRRRRRDRVRGGRRGGARVEGPGPRGEGGAGGAGAPHPRGGRVPRAGLRGHARLGPGAGLRARSLAHRAPGGGGAGLGRDGRAPSPRHRAHPRCGRRRRGRPRAAHVRGEARLRHDALWRRLDGDALGGPRAHRARPRARDRAGAAARRGAPRRARVRPRRRGDPARARRRRRARAPPLARPWLAAREERARTLRAPLRGRPRPDPQRRRQVPHRRTAHRKLVTTRHTPHRHAVPARVFPRHQAPARFGPQGQPEGGRGP